MSPAALFASLFISSVGGGLFLYGKKQARLPQFIVGISLMVYPYFIASPVAMCAIATALILGLLATLRFGL